MRIVATSSLCACALNSSIIALINLKREDDKRIYCCNFSFQLAFGHLKLNFNPIILRFFDIFKKGMLREFQLTMFMNCLCLWVYVDYDYTCSIYPSNTNLTCFDLLNFLMVSFFNNVYKYYSLSFCFLF